MKNYFKEDMIFLTTLSGLNKLKNELKKIPN
jgi:hypothetical protein